MGDPLPILEYLRIHDWLVPLLCPLTFHGIGQVGGVQCYCWWGIYCCGYYPLAHNMDVGSFNLVEGLRGGGRESRWQRISELSVSTLKTTGCFKIKGCIGPILDWVASTLNLVPLRRSREQPLLCWCSHHAPWNEKSERAIWRWSFLPTWRPWHIPPWRGNHRCLCPLAQMLNNCQCLNSKFVDTLAICWMFWFQTILTLCVSNWIWKTFHQVVVFPLVSSLLHHKTGWGPE